MISSSTRRSTGHMSCIWLPAGSWMRRRTLTNYLARPPLTACATVPTASSSTGRAIELRQRFNLLGQRMDKPLTAAEGPSHLGYQLGGLNNLPNPSRISPPSTVTFDLQFFLQGISLLQLPKQHHFADAHIAESRCREVFFTGKSRAA